MDEDSNIVMYILALFMLLLTQQIKGNTTVMPDTFLNPADSSRFQETDLSDKDHVSVVYFWSRRTTYAKRTVRMLSRLTGSVKECIIKERNIPFSLIQLFYTQYSPNIPLHHIYCVYRI